MKPAVIPRDCQPVIVTRQIRQVLQLCNEKDKTFAFSSIEFYLKQFKAMLKEVRSLNCRKYFVRTNPVFCNAALYPATKLGVHFHINTECITSAFFNVGFPSYNMTE